MSSFFDMISSVIALLMSAAFLHFGASSADMTPKNDPIQSSAQSSVQSSVAQSQTPKPKADWDTKQPNQTAAVAQKPAAHPPAKASAPIRKSHVRHG